MPRLAQGNVTVLWWLCAVVLWFIGFAGHASESVISDNVRVEVYDAMTQTGLAQREIVAYKVLPNGTNSWIAKQTTNEQGIAWFALPAAMAQGGVYFFKLKAFNQVWTTSKNITHTDTFEWRVGNVSVKLVDGTRSQTTSPLINRELQVIEIAPDDTQRWHQRLFSDARGKVRLDLPKLDQGYQYTLKVRSLLTGDWKAREPIASPGEHLFVVSNPPLTVTLIDAFKNVGIANQKIVVYEQLPDGSKQWSTAKSTDLAGQVTFDLDGLGKGRQYFLKTKVYSGWSYTQVFSDPQMLNWLVGRVAIYLTDGTQTSQPPLANIDVYIKEVKPDGRLYWYQQGITDDKGVLRLDLEGLEDGAQYVLSARSPATGMWKSSQLVTQEGVHRFLVGNTPLSITLRNGFTDDVFAEQAVHAIEVLADGSHRWRAQALTDLQGLVLFDLEGLGKQRRYFLQTQAFHKKWEKTVVFDAPVTETWTIGTVQVDIVDGTQSTPQPLVNYKVHVVELLADDTQKWFSGVISNAQGVLFLDLPGIEDGRRFQLQARSPLTGRWKLSDVIDTDVTDNGGTTRFVVGNQPLVVSTIDAISGSTLADIKVVVYEQQADGTLVWVTKQWSQQAGEIIFELDGLGDGRVYQLRAKPFGVGYTFSKLIDQPGRYDFRLGKSPVTLIDKTSQQALVNKKLDGYRVVNDELKWVGQGYTDVNGVVKFDFDRDSNDGTSNSFIVIAKSPYGLKQHYYSGRILAEGPIDMMISRDEPSPLDLKPPVVLITTPLANQVANAAGFILQGYAVDNTAIDHITVQINDSVLGEPSSSQKGGIAQYEPASGRWQYAVTSTMLSAGGTVAITAQAQDKSNNVSTVTASYQVVRDQQLPTVQIQSHQMGDKVAATGFTLMGMASDDVNVTEVRASVDDPILGRTLDRMPLILNDVAASNARVTWTLTVLGAQLSPNSEINVTLAVADSVGNWVTQPLRLVVQDSSDNPYHVLNRISFGATDQSLAAIQSVGVNAYIEQQLHPEQIDDSVLQQRLDNEIPDSKNTLQAYLLTSMATSERQLLEVMTWFWDNHFNTDIRRHGHVEYELAEHQLFRQHALGQFRDLLGVSAKSPAMLSYLDSVKNYKNEPNENYARELMELHTLSVDGGYTHHDIEALAKVFTGWHIKEDVFYFNANQHDDSDKVFLGQNLAGIGIAEGERALDILSQHPSTAHFICGKLIALFVTDSAASRLQQTCATVFLNSQGNIREVVKSILVSVEFNDKTNQRNKIKTPLEYLLASVRQLGVTVDWRRYARTLSNMGMPLLENVVPTGWPETGTAWINTGQLMQRMRFVSRLNAQIVHDSPAFWSTRLRDRDLLSAEQVLGYFNELLFAKTLTPLEWNVALDRLNSPEIFDANAADVGDKLSHLLTTLMAFPNYQYQ